jgi:hypothetical protein
VTPQIGRSQLPGKYVFGGYYWGIENTSFFGEPFDGKFGFYWQAHQMLSCEPSPYVVEETSGDAKTSPNVAFYGKLEISETEGIAHETPQKAGGWGFPNGDEGSGAWLGLEAVRLTLHWVDGRDEPSPVLVSVYAHFDNDLMRLVIWAS